MRRSSWLFLRRKRLVWLLVGLTLVVGGMALPGLTLPPPDDQPEEVLRTEIILEARSPKDGSLITAAQYAELQAQLEADSQTVEIVDPEIRRIIHLLRVRRVLRAIFPFIP